MIPFASRVHALLSLAYALLFAMVLVSDPQRLKVAGHSSLQSKSAYELTAWFFTILMTLNLWGINPKRLCWMESVNSYYPVVSFNYA